MKDDEAPRISSFFAVSGERFDPHRFTAAVGIQPTSVQETALRRGTLITGEPHFLAPHWWLVWTKVPSFSTDEELRKVLTTLWPQKEAIKRFVSAESVSACFGTTVTILGLHPEYSIEPPTLSQLAYFGYPWRLDVMV